jgi:hypothetical protein
VGAATPITPVRFEWGRSLLFLGNLCLAKGFIYLAPLAIAAIAPPATYGAVELAWSFGLLLGSFTIAIPLSGIGQRFLIGRQRGVADEILLLVAIFTGASLAATAVLAMAKISPAWLLVAAACGSTALHSATASVARIYGRPNLTAWSDGTAMLSTALIVAVCILVGAGIGLVDLTIGYVVLATLACLASGWGFARFRAPRLRERLRRSIQIGLPMTMGGVMALWLGVGGRLTFGILLPSQVAAYGVAFRVAGLALGIHQLSVTLFYARLYVSRTREADRLFGHFYAAVALLSLLISAIGPAAVARLRLAALPAAELQSFTAILPVVVVQIFYWVGFAMLQTRINRSGLAARAIWPLVIVTIGGTGLIFGLTLFIRPAILWLSWGIALHAAAYFATAYLILQRARLPHVRMGSIGLCGGALLILLALGREALS